MFFAFLVKDKGHHSNVDIVHPLLLAALGYLTEERTSEIKNCTQKGKASFISYSAFTPFYTTKLHYLFRKIVKRINPKCFESPVTATRTPNQRQIELEWLRMSLIILILENS